MKHLLILAAIILPLGLDTFALAAALGIAGIQAGRRMRTDAWRGSLRAEVPGLTRCFFDSWSSWLVLATEKPYGYHLLAECCWVNRIQNLEPTVGIEPTTRCLQNSFSDLLGCRGRFQTRLQRLFSWYPCIAPTIFGTRLRGDNSLARPAESDGSAPVIDKNLPETHALIPCAQVSITHSDDRGLGNSKNRSIPPAFH
jgi:hypothetical protein